MKVRPGWAGQTIVGEGRVEPSRDLSSFGIRS